MVSHLLPLQVYWTGRIVLEGSLSLLNCVSSMRRQECSQVTYMMSALTLNSAFAVIPVTLKSQMLMPNSIFSAFVL